MKSPKMAFVLGAFAFLTIGCASQKTVRPASNYTDQELQEIFGSPPPGDSQETVDN